jgi:hypothetical protein
MEGDSADLNLKRKKKVTKRSDQLGTSFKWTTDIHVSMGNYFRENYQLYKVNTNFISSHQLIDRLSLNVKSLSQSTQRGAKVKFMKCMKEHLGLTCTEQQFKNGFSSFLKKYQDIRQKLNQSGFGVDPDVDATLNKGIV